MSVETGLYIIKPDAYISITLVYNQYYITNIKQSYNLR
jgi:hypothetical protein